YTGGFTNTLDVTGLRYVLQSNLEFDTNLVALGADMRLIQLTNNALIRFEDGNLTNSAEAVTYGYNSQQLQITTNNLIKFITNFNNVTLTNKVGLKSTNSQLANLTITFDKLAGKMSGTFTNPISRTATGAAKTIL